MYDEIDSYVSNRLKNWAAQQTLPRNGHAQLMLKAAAYPRTHDENIPSVSFWRKYLLGWQLPQQVPYGEMVLGPFTQSRAWCLHIATMKPLAT